MNYETSPIINSCTTSVFLRGKNKVRVDTFIQWNDAFQESKKEPLKGATIEFKINKALTEEKG